MVEELSKLLHIDWNAREDARANARRELPRLISGYFAHVRKLLSHHPSPAELHKVRLATKRVRYTLDMFRSCYGPGLETRLRELRQIQQLLGDVNDAAATGHFLAAGLKKEPRGRYIADFLEERASQKAAEFLKYWTDVFDAPDREQWWTTYLTRTAARTVRRTAPRKRLR
jgi:CHAD domain-containing protein